MINPGLNNKTVLITGANSGIGREISTIFAEMGSNIIFHYFEDDEMAEEMVNSLRNFSVDVLPFKGDLKNASVINNLFDKAVSKFGSIDILINNAAVAEFPDNTFETNEKSFYNHFDINVKAVLLLINRFVNLHKDQGKVDGHIVNISTDASQKFANQISYGASKAAVEAYTRSIAIEVGKFGITVNCVAPGPVQTGYIDKELEEYVLPTIPMNRLGVPKDIADAVVFFSSDQSKWITGQVILVSGGHYI
ncbi:SDR family NAD(P)-dependent oxidoreductase [Lacicoccus qingdaonensis]|uniref:3-oxoacyl-[acyl-carrier protein] reductase n=1 Tax=Lacicoccus qingdaonensis TaxID=576118 RepID=A0A1G9J978_9BACL|nr:SDR family oxidoreductase [Salinicoccus qingdaonensis]SDL34038.1 3-oxoacyl-[acyl-carrier protein] reductase [Salinicoccus qingdaonensis]